MLLGVCVSKQSRRRLRPGAGLARSSASTRPGELGYTDWVKVTEFYDPLVLYTMRGLPHLGHDIRDAGGVSDKARKGLMLSLVPSIDNGGVLNNGN